MRQIKNLWNPAAISDEMDKNIVRRYVKNIMLKTQCVVQTYGIQVWYTRYIRSSV